MVRFAAAGILIAFFALNVYRAATQSFVTDEAYSFYLYIGREPFNLLHKYDANLHVLHTLATWASVRLFGLSELTFRLPTLIGCALYFAAVYRIARCTTWVAILLLVANPLIEDHLSAGRGYGLALAWFAWAYVEVLRESRAEPVRLSRVAAFLALSVATNLTFLFPAAGLLAALMWRRRSILLESLSGPFLVLTVLMVAVPLSNLERGSFYFGADSLPAFLDVMVSSSIGQHYLGWKVPAAAGVLLVACIVTALRLDRQRSYTNAFYSSATLTLTAVGLVASHQWVGIPYPWQRTGVYLLFLVPLCLLPLVSWKTWMNLPLAALGIYMATHIDPAQYQEWAFDASARDIVNRMEERHKATGAPVRITCSVPMTWTYEMYRKTRGLDWITAIDSEAWKPGYDYYIFGWNDFERVQKMGLHEMDWPVNSLIKVAVPKDSVQ